MKAKRLWLNIIAACLLLALGAISATVQSQITLTNSSQNVTFTATSTFPSASANVALGSCSSTTFTGTCTLSGSTLFGSDIGTYTFTTTTSSAFTISSSSAVQTVWPFTTPGGATSTFSYSAADGDSLTGTVSWTTANNGSGNPHLDGTITVTSRSGDMAFTSAFPVSSVSNFDLLLSKLTCTPSITPCTVEQLFVNGSGSASATVSSGQVPAMPEPGSMLLLGSGLLVAGSFLRRRRRV